MGLRKSKRQKGFSLIEVMVTLAVSSIVILGLSTSLMNIYRTQSNVTKKDEANEFTASFSRVLSQNGACAEMLRGLSLPPTGNPIEFRVPNFIKTKAQEALLDPGADDLVAGNQIAPGLLCKSLTIENSNFSDQSVFSGGGRFNQRIADVVLGLALVQSNGERLLRPRRFHVPVLVNQNNQIESCASEMEVEDACEVTGSLYDGGTGTCVPQKNCYIKGSFTRSICIPSTNSCPPSTPNAMTGAADCPDGAATESQTGQSVHSYSENCGKKCTRKVTNTKLHYICLKCN